MRGFVWVGIVIILLAFAWNVGRSVERVDVGREAYYRGVYEACVRTSLVDGVTTSFDLLTCQELETRARREQWFEHEIVVQ